MVKFIYGMLAFLLLLCTTGCLPTPDTSELPGLNVTTHATENENNHGTESCYDETTGIANTPSGPESVTNSVDNTAISHNSSSSASKSSSTTTSHTAMTGSSTVPTPYNLSDVPIPAIHVKPYHFQRTYTFSKRKLIIDAQVYEPKVNTLHTFEAEPRLATEAEQSLIIHQLVGDAALTPDSIDPRFLKGKNVHGEFSFNFQVSSFWAFSTIGKAGNYPIKKAKDARHAPGCETSVDDAITTVNNVMNDFPRLQDMVPTYYRIQKQASFSGKILDATGSYAIFYTQYADNLPMPVDYIGGSVVSSSFFVNDKGVLSSTMKPFDLTITSTLKKWLSLEEACARLEAVSNSLYFSQYTPIFEISFEYMRNSTGEVVPVWRFCVDQMEILEKGLDQSVYQSNDMVVNAVTGEVFQTFDRYPSFVCDDGSFAGGHYKNM